MTHVLLPLTLIDTLISILLDTKSISLAIKEVTSVSRSIGPSHGSFALNIVLIKLSFVFFARLSKVVFACAMELSINEVSLIDITIEFEFAYTSFLTVDKVSRVLDLVILPLLSALTMVHVVQPLTIVHRTILVNEDTFTASFALFPLTVVNVTIFVRNSSFAMEQSFVSHALVSCSIRELNETETLPSGLVLVGLPLALVLATLTDIDEEGVPVIALAASLWAKLIGQVVICEQRVLTRDQFAFQVDWLLLTGNCQRLDHLLESPSSNGAGRPSLDGVHVFHFYFSFLHTMLVLDA